MAQNFEFEKNGVAINSLTVTDADFDADGLWSTDAATVGNFPACQAFVEFEAINPDANPETGNIAVAWELYARLETEMATGHWHTMVSTLDKFDSVINDPTKRQLTADPAILNINPESELVVSDNESRAALPAHIGDKVRLCLYRKPVPNGGAPFVSVTVTMDGQLY